MLVVDSTSSSATRNDLWRDLDRRRSGRNDSVKEVTRNILSGLGSRADDVARQTHIITLDLGRHSDAGTSRALEILADSIGDDPKPRQPGPFWRRRPRSCARRGAVAISKLCATFWRRQASRFGHLVRRESGARIFDTKKLLGDDEPALALSMLREIESDLTKSGIRDSHVVYRISQHRASAFLQLGRCGVTATRRA